MSWSELLLGVVAAYVLCNAVFALLYLAGGNGIAGARPGSFWDAFLFSVQTISTIGYGGMQPTGAWVNAVVTVEALLGLLSFAVVAGLVFARFSRPTARILFSQVAVIGPYDRQSALMIRMANARGNHVIDAHLKLSMLTLRRSIVPLFGLTWTAIHVLDEESPLHGATPEALEARQVEIIAVLVGTDETFNQTIHALHSWLPQEIAWNARFTDILERHPDGHSTVHYERFHDVQPLESGPA
jgi:inward rectifier potassium channel